MRGGYGGVRVFSFFSFFCTHERVRNSVNLNSQVLKRRDVVKFEPPPKPSFILRRTKGILCECEEWSVKKKGVERVCWVFSPQSQGAGHSLYKSPGAIKKQAVLNASQRRPSAEISTALFFIKGDLVHE